MSNNRNVSTTRLPLVPLVQSGELRIVEPTTKGILATSVDELICMDIPRPPYDCVETAEGWVRFEGREDVLPATPKDEKPCVRLYDRSLGDEWLSRFTPHRFPPDTGVYTWLLYTEEGSSELHFVCKKTQSLYEIGTRHKAIARDPTLGVHTVYGAGELERSSSGFIQFNLASGAYMLNFLQGTARNKSSQEKRRKIVEMVQTLLPGASDTEDDTTSLLSGKDYRFRVYAFAPIPTAILNHYRMRLSVIPCDPPNASSSAMSSSSAAAVLSTPPRTGGGGGFYTPLGRGSSAAAVLSTPPRTGGGGGFYTPPGRGSSAAAVLSTASRAGEGGESSAAAVPRTPPPRAGGGGSSAAFAFFTPRRRNTRSHRRKTRRNRTIRRRNQS